MKTPPPDKVLHFAAGTAACTLGVLASALAWRLGFPGPAPMAWGATACAVAAVVREAYNRRQGGAFDWQDIAATLAGALPVLAAVGVQP